MVVAANLAGEWKAEFDTQMGVQKYPYTLKRDGDKVTGKANSDVAGEKREVELKEGKLEGDTITFAWVGGFSSAPNTQPVRALISQPSAAKEKLRLLWVSCGDKDGLMSISKPFHEGLALMGIPPLWHVDSGGHSWPVWKNDLYLLAQLLFKDE